MNKIEIERWISQLEKKSEAHGVTIVFKIY